MKAYMVGKMYEARKNTQGGDRRSEEFSNGQKGHLKERREVKDGTAGEIGREIGMDGKTVRRNEKFAKGVGAPEGNNNAIKRDAQIGQLVSTSDKEKHGVSGKIALELNVGGNGSNQYVKRDEQNAQNGQAAKTTYMPLFLIRRYSVDSPRPTPSGCKPPRVPPIASRIRPRIKPATVKPCSAQYARSASASSLGISKGTRTIFFASRYALTASYLGLSEEYFLLRVIISTPFVSPSGQIGPTGGHIVRSQATIIITYPPGTKQYNVRHNMKQKRTLYFVCYANCNMTYVMIL